MKIRNIFLLLAISSCFIPAVAQRPDQTHNLNEEDLTELTKRATEKVNEFNRHLSYIATPIKVNSLEEQKNVEATKSRKVKQCLNLFIGKGYEYEDTYGNTQAPVVMEVSSVNRKTKAVSISRPQVRQYLDRMRRNYHRYDRIEITSSDCYIADNSLKEVDDGLYMCVLSYTQFYRGERGDRIAYQDRTDKNVVVYFERTEIDGKVRWLIWLGNISVKQTE